MIRAALASVLFLSLTACNDEPEATEFEAPNYCSERQAKLAGESRVAEILLKVENEDTRLEACSEIDDILRDQFSSREYEEFRPSNCEWSSSVSRPYHFAEAILVKNEDHLEELCEWRRRDAEKRGRRILDSLPAEERKQIEREWNSYGQ